MESDRQVNARGWKRQDARSKKLGIYEPSPRKTVTLFLSLRGASGFCASRGSRKTKGRSRTSDKAARGSRSVITVSINFFNRVSATDLIDNLTGFVQISFERKRQDGQRNRATIFCNSGIPTTSRLTDRSLKRIVAEGKCREFIPRCDYPSPMERHKG